MLGDVAGLRLLHLQCHFGLDTLAWARAGAHVTGLDFSPAAIDAAREIARRAGLSERSEFVCSDVYDATTALDHATFDVVYVSLGALCWLPSVDRWAAQVGALVAPGGRFYIHDRHPLAWALADDSLVDRAHVLRGSRAVRRRLRRDVHRCRPTSRAPTQLRMESRDRRDRHRPDPSRTPAGMAGGARLDRLAALPVAGAQRRQDMDRAAGDAAHPADLQPARLRAADSAARGSPGERVEVDVAARADDADAGSVERRGARRGERHRRARFDQLLRPFPHDAHRVDDRSFVDDDLLDVVRGGSPRYEPSSRCASRRRRSTPDRAASRR